MNASQTHMVMQTTFSRSQFVLSLIALMLWAGHSDAATTLQSAVAFQVSHFDGTNQNTVAELDVCFSGSVDPASATTPANYSVTGGGGPAVTNATLRSDGQSVVLGLAAAVGPSATLNISGITGTNGAAVTPSSVAVQVSDLLAGDLGVVGVDPIDAGSVFSCQPADYDFTAGGNDIFNNNDGGFFVYKSRADDFDLKVRVESLRSTSGGPPLSGDSKGGILIEENPITQRLGQQGTRHFYAMVQPDYWEVSIKLPSGSATYLDPPNFTGVYPVYPNAWLRLSRVGNTLLAYYGTDGITWTNLSYFTPVPQYPDSVLVGLGTSSHNNGSDIILAKYHQYGDYAYPAPNITITRDLQSIAREANSKTLLSVAATATSSGRPLRSRNIGYQWQKNAVDISGARSSSLTTAFLTPADNGATYRCLVKIAGTNLASAGAVLTVTADCTRPSIRHALSLGTNEVLVYFSEPVNPASANVAANYQIDNGITVTGAALDSQDPTLVRLNTSGLTVAQTYNLTVNTVADLSGNAVPAGIQRAFTSQSYTVDTNKPPILLLVDDMLPLGALTNRGFKLRLAQNGNDDSATLGTQTQMRFSADSAEDLLAGKVLIADPDTEQAITNVAAVTSYVETNIINYSRDDVLPSDAGAIPGNVAMPGLPGTGTFPYFGFAMETLTYVKMTAGVHRFGVAEAGGQRVLAARSPGDADAMALSERVGSSGLAFQTFDVIAPRDGLYPLRLVYYTYTRSDASVDWWEEDLATGVRTAINADDGHAAFQPPVNLVSGPLAATQAANGDVVISWSTSGHLQSAAQVSGSWGDVVYATSPHRVLACPGQKFFRLRQ